MDSPDQSGPVRIGVLGASSIAWRRTLTALQEVPDSTVVAVASRERDKAERFAARFGCAAVHGYEELLERDDIDAVYVSVPNSLHHQWVHRLLMSDKHVLAEKPLTIRPADTAALIGLAADRGLVLRENIAFIHHGLHRRVAELVGAGRIGHLRHIDAAFCFPPLPETDVRYRADLGGGALLDAGLYPVRLAQYFLGDELTVVGAVLREDPVAGVDVAGSAVLVAATGETVTLNFGFEHSYGAHYTLWGSTGRLSVDRAFTPPATMAPLIRIDEQDHAEEITFPAEHQFAKSAASFVEAVLRSRSTGSDPGHDDWATTALRTAELLDRISASAHRVTAGGQA
ncbi:Gfo/Idh/MocA family protein [Streptomyces pratensis]|uniref:Gfo/Idh/MocA family protein n=1 Tax=Streptomyces pratensis TaxID=1169025 RepID=UPI0036411439